MKRVIKPIICLILISILCTGCSKNSSNKEKLELKVLQELDYIDTEIVSMLNSLNNIYLENYTLISNQIKIIEGTNSQTSVSSLNESIQNQTNNENKDNSQELITTQMERQTVIESLKKDIEWDKIEADIEILNSSWDIILLDLYSSNVKDQDILEFSGILDLTIISIKNKNKQETLSNLANLYSYIPNYLNQIEGKSGNQKVKQSKSYLINAYSVVDMGNWSEINDNINECDNTFKEIANDIEFSKNKEYKINKTYVLLKELKNSLSTENTDIFYIKYKNLIQSINAI